jgi:hypothetical protein
MAETVEKSSHQGHGGSMGYITQLIARGRRTSW